MIAITRSAVLRLNLSDIFSKRHFTIKRCLAYSKTVTIPRINDYSHIELARNESSAVGKFFTYSKPEISLYLKQFVKPEFFEELEAFGDFSLLIRKPFSDTLKDLIDLRNLQQNKKPPSSVYSVPRFILYGQPGTGISTLLGQITCFAGINKWLIFPFTNAETWLDTCFDLIPSEEYHFNQHKHQFTGECFDFPSRSANWLRYFLLINENILKETEPVIQQPIHWTKSDIMPSGTSWSDVITFGITREKYSTDCIGILLREMRKFCSAPGGPPCLLVVDGVNFLWCRGTNLKDKTLQVKVTPDRLAIVHHLRRAMQGDWYHGAILTSTNIRCAWPTDREKYTPGYLLGKRGFDCLDPFIPVHIENYNPSELNTMLQFYTANNWLTNPAALTAEGLAEIKFLADNNPLELSRIVSEW